MYHESKGLFFERLHDGSVHIIKTYDGREPRPDNIVLDHAVSEEIWGSIVCSVSKEGETALRWKEARAFHGTEFSELLVSGLDEEWVPTKAEITAARKFDYCGGVATQQTDEQVIAQLRDDRFRKLTPEKLRPEDEEWMNAPLGTPKTP